MISECNDVGMSGEDGEVQWYTGKTEKKPLVCHRGDRTTPVETVLSVCRSRVRHTYAGLGKRWEASGVKKTKTIPWRVWKLRSEESCLPDQWYFRWVCKRTALNIWREIWGIGVIFLIDEPKKQKSP